MATTINNIIACNEPHANLDTYYGPYTSLQEALETLNTETIAGVVYTKRAIGLSVGILENGEITEYWFKAGTADADLVKKVSDASLPSGVKIVTFNKNGGEGTQNSILTDSESNITLPQPTITKSGSDFKCWVYNNNNYNPGEIVTITTNTVISVEWETVAEYTVSFTSEGKVNSVSGTVNGEPIASGGQFVPGTTVVLTANVESGVTVVWEGKPNGAVEGDKTLTFNVTDSNINVTATTGYVVNFSKGEGVDRVTGKANGKTVRSGKRHDTGTEIVLTAIVAESGSEIVWEGAPQEHQENENTLTFTVGNSDISIIAKAQQKYKLIFAPGNESIEFVTGMVDGSEILSGYTVAAGSQVELTAAPIEGHVFDKWDGLPAGSDITSNPVSFKINEPLNIQGFGKELPYMVSFSGASGVTVTGEANGSSFESGDSFITGTNIILTGVPKNGGKIVWSGDMMPEEYTEVVDPITQASSLIFQVKTSDVNVTATKITTYTLEFSGDENVEQVIGSIETTSGYEGITSGQAIASGSNVKLEAVVKTGCEFTSWSGLPSGSDITSNPVEFTVNKQLSITANTQQLTMYSVDWSINPVMEETSITGTYRYKGVTTTLDKGASCPSGSDVTLTITYPDNVYLTRWDGKPTGSQTLGNTLTILSIDKDVSVIAQLENKYKVHYGGPIIKGVATGTCTYKLPGSSTSQNFTFDIISNDSPYFQNGTTITVNLDITAPNKICTGWNTIPLDLNPTISDDNKTITFNLGSDVTIIPHIING